jgi:hypothetical protein
MAIPRLPYSAEREREPRSRASAELAEGNPERRGELLLRQP